MLPNSHFGAETRADEYAVLARFVIIPQHRRHSCEKTDMQMTSMSSAYLASHLGCMHVTDSCSCCLPGPNNPAAKGFLPSLIELSDAGKRGTAPVVGLSLNHVEVGLASQTLSGVIEVHPSATGRGQVRTRR